MKKFFCDRCGKETDVGSLRYLEVTHFEQDGSSCPSMPAMEICVFCLEEIKPTIKGDV